MDEAIKENQLAFTIKRLFRKSQFILEIYVYRKKE